MSGAAAGGGGRGIVSSAQQTASKAVGSALERFAKEAQRRLTSPHDDRWAHINGLLGSLGMTSAQHTTKLTPYYDTGEAYRDMWRAVDAAKSRVVWHTYICKDDVVGRKTLEKLVAARKRGVEVELLYDSGGNITGRGRLMAELKEAGGRVITYRPFHKHFVRYFTNKMDWRLSPGLRNHRKILVVDGEVGFIGGLNIGDDYAEPTVGGNGRFRDTMCAVRGAAVADLITVCRDTVVNQEGAELHPSLTRRWGQWARGQWARRVGSAGTRAVSTPPLPQRASIYIMPEIHRAKQSLKRRLQRAEQLGRITRQKATESRASKMRSVQPAVVERMQAALGRSRPSVREHVVSLRAALKAPRETYKVRAAAAHVRAAAAQAKARELRGRATRYWVSRRRFKHRHLYIHRSPDVSDEQLVDDALKRFSRYKASTISPADLVTPTPGAPAAKPPPSEDNSADGAATATDAASVPQENVGAPVAALNAHETLSEDVPLSRTSDVDSAQVLMCNPHTRDWSLQRALWVVTREAHHRVWVTTPYFLPHGLLFRAVLASARSGVDVRIIAGSNTTTDPWFMWYASQYVRHRLLAAGVKVYEFDGGKIMHAKTVVVDRRWACIGSYNWDVLSNKLLEASVAAYDRGFARTMEEHFLQDMAMSKRITEDDYLSRPLWTRVACWFFFHGVWLSEAITFRGYRDRDLHSPMGHKLDDP
jgi:cardiolipin synthase